jgi:uncharacterized protein YcfJ
MKKGFLAIFALSSLLSAESLVFTEYVSVSNSQPQYERVSERIPYQECVDERVRVNRAYSNNRYNESDRVAASVLGGTIGGVIGHQIGKGKGNDVATVGGAILGTIVGGNMAHPNQRQSVYQEPEYQTRRNCTTKYRSTGTKSRLTGYKNIAYYKGKKIVKYSNERLSSIPITVTIDY